MSDQSQGESWWQAADGKWYSPESHPDFRPSPPATQQVPVPPPPSSSSQGGGLLRAKIIVPILAVRALLVVAAVVLGGGDDDSSLNASSSEDSTTTTARETTTTEARPTTTRATTTTAGPTTDLALFKEIFPPIFADNQAVVDAIKSESTVEALIAFEYRPDPHEVYMDLASSYEGGADFHSIYDSQAWDLTQVMSLSYWGADFVKVVDISILPAWHLILDGELTYVCPGPLMADFASKSAGQQQFDAECIK